MQRRSFLTTTLAGAVTAAASAQEAQPPGADGDPRPRAARPPAGATGSPDRGPFKLHYAPHLGMFRQHAGGDEVAELEFIAAAGFRALEDNGMRGRPVAQQERIASAMTRFDLQMGVFVANDGGFGPPLIASGKADVLERFLANVRDSLEVARRVNAGWATVVVGNVEQRLDWGFQRANVIEALKRAAGLCEPHGLVLVCEPLNWRDHPGQFLRRTDEAYSIMKAVGSPSCKILFDIYHQQVSEGNLIPNIDAAWDEIAYFQIGDNPGRREPGTGEINYRNVFKHIHGRGFTGIMGMEHGNSRDGREGEQAVIDAYVAADGF